MKALSHQRSGRASPSDALIPTSMKQRSPRILKENLDPNPSAVESSPFRPSTFPPKPPASKNRSPLPPRPPTSSNLPLKRKLTLETLAENGSQALDSVVQVIVRMRPLNKDGEEKEHIVQKISPTSISILDHTFTFDSVADVTSTQQDIYQLVGIPLVENCLAGFNSSIFAYGQTGSGKTYTMWGPPSTLSEDDLSSCERGLTPRVFDLLFYRINEEQAKSSDKELSYHCRCSFLEIYNEQITDLLDPAQRTLQIREDVRTGVYVDFLTEECVCTMKDVNQLLIKGLANRRTGATSINAESSRSHCVFTCVVESRSKMADGLSSLRISRINLVDLAGSERQKLTGAAGDRLKEAGNINRSLSQLGNLINILAEVSQSGKQRHIPYRDSKLTFLLQESLGGNAKLAMICAISPSQSCKNETFSTLRFAQRAKAIKNKAIVNEVMQDDVKVLREQIRQLKDELVRMKSNGSTLENNGSYSTGWNARRSLNLLRMSLNRPTILPAIKDDSDEEMEIDEDDVERPYIHSVRQSSSSEEKVSVHSKNSKELRSSASNNEVVLGEIQPMQRFRSVCGTDQVCEMIDIIDYIAEDSQPEKIAGDEVHLKSDMEEYGCIDDVSGNSHYNGAALPVMDQKVLVLQDKMLSTERKPLEEKTFVSQDPHAARDSANISFVDRSHDCTSSPNSIVVSSNLSIVPSEKSPVLQLPSLSISPVSQGYSRKSIRISSSMSASPRSTENKKLDIGVLNLSFSGSLVNKPANASIARTSKNVLAPTEHLAASLHHGLQVIENHQNNSAVRRSAFRFSMRPVELKPLMPVSKIDVAVQTLAQELEMSKDLSTFVCSNCKNKASPDKCGDTNSDKDLQLVPIDGPQTSDQLKQQVPKVVEKVLAGAIRREMALEDHCVKQAAEIVQLNRLVQQYKHERECNAIIEQTREDKISRLEGLMDGILPREEFMDEEFISLANEHKLLKEKYENHPEVLRVNVELKRVQDELDGYRNFFDMGERDVLMEEIQDLRTQLEAYVDSSSMSNRKLGQLLRLTHPSVPISAPLKSSELIEESADEKHEQERRLWTERESIWISLSEDLRLELEATRSLSENRKMELDSEKKCSEELKEALQIAMQGYARILEQYADLEEKHMVLLNRNRKISEGIEDVKRAAAKAGLKKAESKFIDSLAAEISALRAEREKEGRYWRDENKGLRAQLRDTAEAVQAAGELLVRLKEAEEATTIAQRRTVVAEQETEKAYQEIDKLKKSYERQIAILNPYLADSRSPKEALRPALNDGPDVATYDEDGSLTEQRWREEFEPSQRGDGEFSRGTEPYAWYSGYDRCNI